MTRNPRLLWPGHPVSPASRPSLSGQVNVMQSLCNEMLLIAYKSLLTFTLWRASVQTWHSPGPVVASGVAPSRGPPPGKPMPAAGETAHVRRLLVDRSRCGLGVSPASTGDTEAPGQGEGQ